MQAIYPDKEIDFDVNAVDYESEIFKIVVSSEDGSTYVTMLCSLDESGIRSIEIDQEVIVF